VRLADAAAAQKLRATGCAGPSGAAATNTAPSNATTSGKQPTAHEDHVRLEY
jgi:hypothetical protein